MKPNKPVADNEESKLLDEVHRAESEIDLYLNEQAAKAEAIVAEAHVRAGMEQEQIVREAEEKYRQKYELLLDEARIKAERILEEGTRKAEDEQSEMEMRKEPVVEKILELVLGKRS